MDTDYITRVENDWTEGNLLVVRDCVQRAVESVRRITEANPEFISPNRPNLEGVMRWVIVETELERAYMAGCFNGLKGGWIHLGGTSVFELRGIYSAMLPHHLSSASEAPRESTLRSNKRQQNQNAPYLPAFDKQEVALDAFMRINTTLVHGDKKAEFAYLRIYDDIEDRSVYTRVGGNIMQLEGRGIAMPEMEQEQIEEAVLKARTTAGDLNKQPIYNFGTSA